MYAYISVTEGVMILNSFYIFADALEYIESRLCEEMTQQDIADACCCSLSSLQKIWRYCSHTSIKEYISKRRLANSAKDILRGEATITDIAFKYQYNSPEVFTRAFTRLWGVSPSAFCEKYRNADIFPRMIADENNVGGNYMGRKVDLSELYDFLRSRADTYVLCFDVAHLTPINQNYGSKAGDEVILEAFRRIDEAAGEDMAVFRIGGDEFAMITGLSDPAEVEKLADKVISQNNKPVIFEGKEIPVAVRTGAVKYAERPFRYDELFGRLHRTIHNAGNVGKVEFYNEG